MVSDGSFQPETSVASYEVRIEDANQANQIVVTQYVPGVREENDAYRAEAAGILAGIELVTAIGQYCNIPSGKVLIGCDGESALSMAFNKTWEIRTSDQHHDIMACIYTNAANPPYQVPTTLDSEPPR